MTTWWRRLAFAVILAAGAAAAAPSGAQAQTIRLVPVVTGLATPVFLTHAGDGSGRLFVLEQPGRIRVLANGTLAPQPFLDLGDRVLAGGEQGLLGLAFHPQFRRNGRFFVNYTRKPDGATVISEFRVLPGRSTVSPERVLLVAPQPFPNHNGGMLAFGPDGLLYIGLGDGGSGGDPGNRAQNPFELLGKILRIDVDRGRLYAIPRNNPFAGGGGAGEIYALGFRNPWRFSFDRGTGWLFAGDVGQNAIEEIDRVRRGGNYGWRIMEGDRCFDPPVGCDRAGLELPIATYTHENGRCSVTGGYVYRGRALRPGLTGTYLYADFCTGEIFGLRAGQAAVLLDTDRLIASFGEDEAGELYVVGFGGTVDRIAAAL